MCVCAYICMCTICAIYLCNLCAYYVYVYNYKQLKVYLVPYIVTLYGTIVCLRIIVVNGVCETQCHTVRN